MHRYATGARAVSVSFLSSARPYLRTIVAVTVPHREGRAPGATIVSDSPKVPVCGFTDTGPM